MTVKFNERHFLNSLFLFFFFYFHQLSVPSPSFPLLCHLLIHSFEFLPSFLLSFLLNFLIIGHLIEPKLNRIKAVFPTLLPCYYYLDTLASNGHWPGKYCMTTNKWFMAPLPQMTIVVVKSRHLSLSWSCLSHVLYAHCQFSL